MTLYIATPVDGGDVWSARVTLGYAEALRRLSLRMPVEMAPVYYSTDIVRARNRIAATVLAKPPSDDVVLWWDDDVIPDDIGIVERMLTIMVRDHLSVLAAPYTSKRHPVRWVHQGCAGGASETAETQFVGFGFTMTSRGCLQVMADHSTMEEDTIDGVEREVPAIFELLRVPGRQHPRRLSEDYSFSQKWRDIGGTLHVYQHALIGHAGSYVYDAHDLK